MNRIYSLVWNRALRALQVASELVAGTHGGGASGGGTGRYGTRKPLALAITAALVVIICAPPALAGTIAGTPGNPGTVGAAGSNGSNGGYSFYVGFKGGNGGKGTKGGDGGVGGAGKTASANVDVALGDSVVGGVGGLGGMGGFGGAGGTGGGGNRGGWGGYGGDGAAGGSGGAGGAAISSAGFAVMNYGSVAGGSGGNGGVGGFGGTGGDGGDTSTSAVCCGYGGNASSGGHAGAGGAGANGGAGVTGANFNLTSYGTVLGGDGGAGGMGGPGGSGGHGGDGTSGQNLVGKSGPYVGTGGNGGNALGGAVGGIGGDGAAGVDGTGFTVTNEAGSITGGNGGDGGNGGNGGIGGNGADGIKNLLGYGGDGGNGGNGGNGGDAGDGGSGGTGVGGSGFTLTNGAAITGGNGGAGGKGGKGGVAGEGGSGGEGELDLNSMGGSSGSDGSSGGMGTGGVGGAGGAGVVAAGNADITNNVGATIKGGVGGAGGYGFDTSVSLLPTFNDSGNGGAGVTGAYFTLHNAGTITGGTGGVNRSNILMPIGATSTFSLSVGGAGVDGASFALVNTGAITGGMGGPGIELGAGGAGVHATGDASVINAGTISGGLSVDGITRADAVDFSHGGNTLTLKAGYQFVGNVVSSSGSTSGGDTLALGGDTDAGFDLSSVFASKSGTYTSTQYVGFNAFAETGTSVWTLSGVTADPQPWDVQAGTLVVGDAAHSSTSSTPTSIAGNVQVENAAVLSGFGSIGGGVTLQSGSTLSPGLGTSSIGTLSIGGNLTLAGGALDMDLGADGDSDRVTVGGALDVTGASTIDLATTSAFDNGVVSQYTLVTTSNGISGGNYLSLGSAMVDGVPATLTVGSDDVTLLTGYEHHIWNPSNGTSLAFSGGDGTWSVNGAAWSSGQFDGVTAMAPQPGNALFSGNAGTVTIDDSTANGGQVTAAGIQFGVSGYVLKGGALELVPDTGGDAPSIYVGDPGNASSNTWMATIEDELEGSDGIVKDGAGTLVLDADNAGTNWTVQDGTLQIGDGTDVASVTASDGSDGSYGVSGSVGGVAVTGGIGTILNVEAGGAAVGGHGGSGVYNLNSGDGGDGGAGGAGISGSGSSFVLTNAGHLTGGNGGDGGHLGDGNGGAGGAGVGGSFALTNSAGGYITGGDGGEGGYTGFGGHAGRGGAGVSGSGMFTVTNAGHITGGIGGTALNYSSGGGVGVSGNGSRFVLTNTGTGYITGGAGGAGDVTSNNTGSSGGAGVSGSFTLTNYAGGRITGGSGGAGGYGFEDFAGHGGNGGAGVSGSSAGFTLTNAGSIAGGDGGAGAGAGNDGVGGVGVYSAGGATVINEGTISGGLDGDGTTQEDAIDFTGGGNTLELVAGTSATINGGILVTRVAGDAADTFELGGMNGNGTFNVSNLQPVTTTSGFNALEKTGGSDWTLTGMGDASQDWSITGGGLIGDATSIVGSVSLTEPLGNALPSVVEFNQSGAGTYAGDVSGTGYFYKDGSGSLIATGTIGDANTIAAVLAGTLQIGSGSTTGTLGAGAVGVSTGATLAFDNSGAVVYGGSVSGTGTLAQDGSGTLTLAGSNNGPSYTPLSGAIDVNAGGLIAGNKDAFGTATIHMAAGTTLGFTTSGWSFANKLFLTGEPTVSLAANQTETWTGVIADGTSAGTLELNGGSGSQLVLDADNTYTGGTNINGGTLEAAHDSALGTGIVKVDSTVGFGSKLVVDAGVTLGNTIHVQNGGELDNAGTLDSTSTDVVASSAGVAIVRNKGAIDGNVLLGGNAANVVELTAGSSITGNLDIKGSTPTLTLDGGAGTSQLYSDAVTGTTTFDGALTKSGAGAWTIDADLSGVSGTTVSAGTLQVGNGGTVGWIGDGAMVDDGALAFDRSDSVTYSGAISGTGSLTQIGGTDGTGTLILTGTNTFTGGTTISGGTLQIGSGGSTGSIAGDVVDNGTLAFDLTGTPIYAGVLSGTGSLLQQGTGVLTLNGDSSGFAGSTTVAAGSLIVGDDTHTSAALGGDVTVDDGATLGGFGTLGSGSTNTVEVKSGGILAPGDSIGTLNVDGDLTLDSGSLLDFEFGAPATSNVFTTAGASDSVSVNGNLALNGATLNVSDLNSAMGPGVYTLFSYTGTLSGAGCAGNAGGGSGSCVAFGTLPAGAALQLQYLSGAKQVNLIDSTGVALNFWDANGAATATQMGGGSGTWANDVANWTNSDGSAGQLVMSPQNSMAIFGGAPGTATTVTVSDAAADGGAVSSGGMQFMVDGYTLQGDALTLVTDNNGNAPVINVGNGNSASAAFTATIDNVLAGSVGVTKTDWGTLVLAGANTFTGGLTINGGAVEIAQGGTPGAGDVTVDDGLNEGSMLQVDSDVSLTNHIVLNKGAVLDNAGALSDTVDDMAVESDTGSAAVNNHDGGTITGKLFGVYLVDGGSVTNTGSGSTIASDRFGVVFDTSSASGTLTNGAGALIESTGTVDGNCSALGDCAVGIDDANVSVQNAGTIEGASGIQLVHGGSVTNEAGGVIEANGSATGDCNSTGDCAIGVVSGGGAGGALTLVNAGSIIGNVQMDPGAANVTTLITGGSIAGDLDIGTNTTSTLTLDGGTGTSQLYSQAVTGATTFDGALTKAGTGTWVIDSDLSNVSGTAINEGTLQIGNYAAATPGSGTTGSIGNADVTDNAALVFDRGDAVTYSGVISGTGSLTQQGTGTLTLTGANTFTGGTTISAGMLKIGAGGGTGSIMGNIIDNAALMFDRSTKIAFAGSIAGNGYLGENNSGWLTLNGDSSGFTGSVEVNNGGLIVGDAAGDGAAVGGNVTVNASTTLGGFGTVGGASDMVTLASGATLAPGNGVGSVGMLTVGGNFTAAQGSLLDFEFGAPAAAPGTFTAFGAGDSLHVDGDLTLDGASLNVTNAGGMGPGLYNVFTYGGALTETNGGLALNNTSGETLQVQNLTADKQINLIDSTGYIVKFWNANGQATATQMGGGDGTWSNASMEWTDATGVVTNEAMSPQPGFGVFGGTPGTVTVDDSAGAVQATGLQFAVDGYTLTGGTLTLVQNTSGAAPIINVGDGSAPSASDTATIDDVLAGTAGLVKSDYGTLVLAGANTFSGGITLNGGTLSVANDANLGAASNALTFAGGTLANTAAFTSARAMSLTGAGTLDTQANLTLTGALSGSGALAKTGSAVLTVNGDGSAFTGATNVKTGTLIVGDDSHAGASLGGMVTVAHGATLGGIGTLGGMDLSGTLSPGGSIGTLHVTGNATFETGSTFSVEANPNGTADQLAVGGTATIKGGDTLVIAQPGNWAPKTTYTIITAGQGVSGKFGSVSDDQAFLTPVLGYQANAVTLSLQRNDIDFQSIGGTVNERNAASGANALGWGSPVYNAVVTLNAPTARYAFDQLSGEYHASQQTARVEDSRYVREAMNQRLRNGDDDPEAAKVGSTHLTAWAHAWGHWGTTDGDGNAAKLSDNGDGLLIGADMPVGTQARVGVTGGASRNSLSINDRDSWGRETSTWLGAFAGYAAGAFGLRGGIAYAWDRIPTSRDVSFPGYTDRLSDNATGDTLTGFIEGSWTFKFGQSEITPFLNVAHTRVETDASTEAGGAAALHSDGATANVSFSTLGARGKVDLAHHLNLHGELGWQHAFGDTTPESNLQFVAGGPGFTVYGVPIAKNAGLGRIGLGWHHANVAIDADYEGLAGNGVKDQAAKVSVSVTF